MHVRALATTASLLPLPLSARGVSHRSSPVHPSSGPSPPLFLSGRLSRGAFSLAHVYGIRIPSLSISLSHSLRGSDLFIRSLACAIGLHVQEKGRWGISAKKRRRWVEFGSRRGRGRTVEKGRKRWGDCACRIKRKTGARQGRTGAVRWHKKRRSGKRKKERERPPWRKGRKEDGEPGRTKAWNEEGKCGVKRSERKERERRRETRGSGWKPQAFCPATTAATRQK